MTDQTRSLTAIMFTDIVGYTSLMGKDEPKAIRVRERHRAILRVLVEQFQGELVDTTGDESLSTFPSALLAVDCALAIQATLRDDPDLKLRIGRTTAKYTTMGRAMGIGQILRDDGSSIGAAIPRRNAPACASQFLTSVSFI